MTDDNHDECIQLPEMICSPTTKEEVEQLRRNLKEVNKLLRMCKKIEKNENIRKEKKRASNRKYYKNRKYEIEDSERKAEDPTYFSCECGSHIVQNIHSINNHFDSQYHNEWVELQKRPIKEILEMKDLDLF